MNEDVTPEIYDDEDEFGSEEISDRDYNDTPELPNCKTVAKVLSQVNADGTLKKIIKARRSDFVHNLIYLDGKKFSFTGRDYLRPIYDRDDKQVLLKTARQVEKCQVINSLITDLHGNEVKIQHLKPGDQVLGINEAGFQIGDVVVASESNGKKPCLRIKTRLGSELIITANHPLRKLQHWENASNLKVGEKIASLRTQGMFGALSQPWATLLGIHLGDGHFYRDATGVWALGITKKEKIVKDLIVSELNKCNFCYNDDYVDPRTGCTRYAFSVTGTWAKVLRDLGLADKRAHEKTIPLEVFKWDKESTRALLRGLWCTDGHCKNVKNRVDLVYGSASPVMIRQIRFLLRKFGIVTTQREYKPKGVKHRKAYLIRVVTRKSLQIFHDIIGPIPAKPFYIPDVPSNSNLDTLPKEMHSIITEVRKTQGNFWKHGSFTAKGLKMSRQYCPTFEKVTKINEYLKDDTLRHILSSDIIWDEVVSIENYGIQDTWAIETTSNTYLSDFIVNHNTTFLANNLTVTSVVMPYNKALYVSPSHMQTRQFSNEKLRPAIDKSPLIKRYFQDSAVSYQVFEKGFTNGSYVFLRSAFRTADRTRGISARILTLDEIQDMITAEIPVIMECTSHFLDARVLMAGTPKTHDNPIEIYWAATTQNEWLVKCQHCGKWNFLDEQNIAPTDLYLKRVLPPGPVCKGCQKPIYPHLHGKWISFKKGAPIQGYRIPQLMVPWICGLYDQWLKLLYKRDHYPLGQLYNEVLGLSYDSASKPVTREELIECCGDYSLWDPANLNTHIMESRRHTLTAGVDWGEGNDGSERSPTGKIRNASYTVLTVGGYVNQKVWRTFLIKKYQGKEIDPEYVVKDIARICGALGVKLVGVDWGHGWGVNNHLIRLLGPKVVVQYQHLPKLKQKMKWDHIGFRYHLHRNFMISELFFDIKQHFVEFPRWKDFEPYAKDILGIYSEYIEYRRELKFDHRPSEPDDFFHSLLYAKLTSDVYHGKSRRFTFDIDGGVGANSL